MGEASASVLVGDIGGTNVRFSIAQRIKGILELSQIKHFPVKYFDNFDAALMTYCAQIGDLPKRAAFAFAGPKFADEIRMTNADWIINETHLKAGFGFDAVSLMNDFAGMARGAMVMPQNCLTPIIAGVLNRTQTIAVLGPGTGLGLAGILPDKGHGLRVAATEGGHIGFAPQSDLERKVLDVMRKERDYVSYEMILSGDGLFRLYLALCEILEQAPVCTHQTQIISAGEDDSKSVARQCVQLFCDILGGFSGNAALALGAFGGVVISGGVGARIAPYIDESNFAARFKNRGPSSVHVKDISVHIITQDDAALYGAASVLI